MHSEAFGLVVAGMTITFSDRGCSPSLDLWFTFGEKIRCINLV